MNKHEFMEELKTKLSHMPYSEVERILSFYEESISDRIESGMSEEEAVSDMGDINSIESDIEGEFTIPVINKVSGSKNKVLWIILIILASPFWLTIASLIFALIITVVALAGSMLLMAFSVELVFATAGLAGILQGIFNMFHIGVPQGLALMAMGIASLGLLLVSIFPLITFTKFSFRVMLRMFKWIGSFFRKKDKARG